MFKELAKKIMDHYEAKAQCNCDGPGKSTENKKNPLKPESCGPAWSISESERDRKRKKDCC